MRVWLNPAWQLVLSDGKVTFQGEKKKYVLDDRKGAVRRLVETLEDGCDNEVLEALTRRDSDCDGLVRALRARGLLVESPTGPAGDDSVHARQWGHLALHTLRPDEAQRRVCDATVMVMGVGGTGSVVLQHLIGAGVGRFVLVDSDDVQLNNLNRQFIFPRAAVGEPKLAGAHAYISDRVPDAEVTLVNRFVSSPAEIDEILDAHPDVHAVAVCIDQPIGSISDAVAESAWARNTPSIFGGVGMQRGFYGPLFTPGRSTVTPKDLAYPENAESNATDGSGSLRSTRYSFGPNNTIIGAWMAASIIHHLAGIARSEEYDVRKIIDFETGRITAQTW
ncbi:Molybdopterin or thiamine biosynthesis adenylyltransferase [Streptomyces zhaozhouensis]|uniref:Molybdopterin or thiamine biosynthesis adenylyltransferase n=1 Tax=Streptomyces zhaozhouensis TaxID=1300267 RepID=A0A286DU10_9ACTN|nr:ThiF family adenylyltransferase [Streptomyces zhaozhouensis]SOD62149.1 Molybdopterin or thiamine biosynthesis adenylyltransferase [Streptomyces zhaozhouensis]